MSYGINDMAVFDQSRFDYYLHQNGIYQPYPEDLDEGLLAAANAYARGKSIPDDPEPFDFD